MSLKYHSLNSLLAVTPRIGARSIDAKSDLSMGEVELPLA